MHIYVMRHGQSEANAHKVVSGSKESPLSELGKHQVKLSTNLLDGLNIDLIVCSPMQRAKQTAQIVADSIGYPVGDIKIMPDLHERDLGELEGKSYKTDDDDSGNTLAAEDADGIEPIEKFNSRVHSALREIISSNQKNVLIVCHMNVGRMLSVILQNRPALDMYSIPRLENAEVVKIA